MEVRVETSFLNLMKRICDDVKDDLWEGLIRKLKSLEQKVDQLEYVTFRFLKRPQFSRSKIDTWHEYANMSTEKGT